MIALSVPSKGFHIVHSLSKFCHLIISCGYKKQRTVVVFARSKMSAAVDVPVNEVKEGKAEVLTPSSVFYNPVQEFNRDLTIAVISEFVHDHFDTVREREAKSARKKIIDQNEATTGEEGAKVKQQTGDENNSCDSKVDGVELTAGVSHPNGIRILEGLAASGLRSVRFGLEIPGVKEVIANDFDKNAVGFIDKNISKNKLTDLVRSNCGDAAMVMYQHKGLKDRFDVIDLDPYGSPSVFLDSAVQAVRDGGLLCVTCTDMAVLCGNSCETCYSKYGSVSLKAKFCHEMALRIILQSIESAANRYSRYIQPLISVSADFYVRVFVKVFTGQAKVKQSVTKLAYVYHCSGCGSHVLQKLANKTPTKGDNYKFTPALAPSAQPVCDHCGFKQHIGGPIWADPMHNIGFLAKVIQRVSSNQDLFNTSERILGMLSMMSEELEDVPLYYTLDEVCNVLHCTAPSIVQFRSAVLNAGYRASLTHCAKNAHKTDAPGKVVWDIMRAWVKDHPVKASRLQGDTPAKAILDKEPVTEVSFSLHPDANPQSRQKGLLRWQVNPEPDWGPKPRAKKSNTEESLSEKRDRRRGKRKERQGDKSFLKQYPCKKLKIGECDLGDSCVYNHDMKQT
ncbi:tRNA (guanine(26)-N(2))-dimethyltransferase-like isoform X1 [Haliotis asinina]|uniref:tRNA (guanine(26)-N(2))-dimethyltransferase-like isoform X1 n=2 Tax=Haliotis asinina TaxID=109174 RepID=UPI003531BD98